MTDTSQEYHKCGGGGVVLPTRYEAFIWTGNEDQTHDPLWFINYLKAHKAHIINDPYLGLHIKAICGTAEPYDVIVYNGLPYGVAFYTSAGFRSVFGEETYATLTKHKEI